jgi:hypothetical protein
VHSTVVADPGGLLVLAHVLEGVRHDVDEIVALDYSALTVAEYLVLRHEGKPDRARAEFGLTCQIVREWFPVRSFAIEVAANAPSGDVATEGLAALELAHSLDVPLVTKNRDLVSRRIPVLYC